MKKKINVHRSDIVQAARAWIGTPYRHGQSRRGVGCDCLGLARGVWRDVIGPEPDKVPPYSPWWAEETGRETMRDICNKFMVPIDASLFRTGRQLFNDGDVLLMRLMYGGPAKHAVITIAPRTVIHSYTPHPVMETEFPDDWRRKIAYAYQFPGVIE